MFNKKMWLDDDRYIIKYYNINPKKEWIDILSSYITQRQLFDYSIRYELEEIIENYIKSDILLVNSGTSAILMSMLIYNFKEDDEIIGPVYSNPAWLSCCKFLKLKPIFVDISKKTLCIDPSLVENKITNKTKAIIFVNHGGYIGNDLRVIKNICEKHNIIMIEDSCSSLGCFNNKKHAGTTGDIGMLSFSQPKLISCGEGGAIIINDINVSQKFQALRYHGGWYEGKDRKYKGIGVNFNISQLLCYYLKAQFDDIKYIEDSKNKVFEIYKKYGINSITNSFISIYSEKAYNIYKKLESLKIQSLYKYYKCIDNLNFYKNSTYVYENLIQLPSSYQLNEKQIRIICGIVKMVDKNV